jgi:hypothetical protein
MLSLIFATEKKDLFDMDGTGFIILLWNENMAWIDGVSGVLNKKWNDDIMDMESSSMWRKCLISNTL